MPEMDLILLYLTVIYKNQHSPELETSLKSKNMIGIPCFKEGTPHQSNEWTQIFPTKVERLNVGDLLLAGGQCDQIKIAKCL